MKAVDNYPALPPPLPFWGGEKVVGEGVGGGTGGSLDFKLKEIQAIFFLLYSEMMCFMPDVYAIVAAAIKMWTFAVSVQLSTRRTH